MELFERTVPSLLRQREGVCDDTQSTMEVFADDVKHTLKMNLDAYQRKMEENLRNLNKVDHRRTVILCPILPMPWVSMGHLSTYYEIARRLSECDVCILFITEMSPRHTIEYNINHALTEADVAISCDLHKKCIIDVCRKSLGKEWKEEGLEGRLSFHSEPEIMLEFMKHSRFRQLYFTDLLQREVVDDKHSIYELKSDEHRFRPAEVKSILTASLLLMHGELAGLKKQFDYLMLRSGRFMPIVRFLRDVRNNLRVTEDENNHYNPPVIITPILASIEHLLEKGRQGITNSSAVVQIKGILERMDMEKIEELAWAFDIDINSAESTDSVSKVTNELHELINSEKNELVLGSSGSIKWIEDVSPPFYNRLKVIAALNPNESDAMKPIEIQRKCGLSLPTVLDILDSIMKSNNGSNAHLIDRKPSSVGSNKYVYWRNVDDLLSLSINLNEI